MFFFEHDDELKSENVAVNALTLDKTPAKTSKFSPIAWNLPNLNFLYSIFKF